MRKVELSYTFGAERQDSWVRNALMDLLHAVQEQGSISGAARQLGLSYRHVWGELRRWEAKLGHPLIVWERGQHARLAPLGEKLLWAERQAQARLAPQIEALRSELERAFAVAFDESAQVLTLFASHDEGLSLLREVAVREAGLHLDVRFCGSVDAIAALNAGKCTVAGFHSSEQPGLGSATQGSYQPLLQPGQHKLIGFAERSQGLIVAPGNPMRLRSMADVARLRARFVHRPLGSGTRLLCEELLAREQVNAADISGHDREEPSHAAVAQAIASGSADAGLGIEAAARSRALDFVPLLQERYYLVCLKEALEQPALLVLRRVLETAQWQQALSALPGYAPWKSGEVLSLKEQLPWWNLPPKKRAKG
jgi:putative molybdopterin biosynthesis protein